MKWDRISSTKCTNGRWSVSLWTWNCNFERVKSIHFCSCGRGSFKHASRLPEGGSSGGFRCSEDDPSGQHIVRSRPQTGIRSAVLEVVPDASPTFPVRRPRFLHRVTFNWLNWFSIYHRIYVYRTSIKYIQETVQNIQNRPADFEGEPTILEELLSRGLSLEDTVVMVIDMLMAGIDTTSHSSSFLFYLLARNPEKQQKLREEILQVVGPRGSPVTASAVNELHYLKACVKETLRWLNFIHSTKNRFLV